MWAAMSDAQKAPYQRTAAAAKAKYDAAATIYRSSEGYKKWEEGRQDFKRAQKAKQKRDQLKAMLTHKPTRGPSGYMRFCAAHRNEFSGRASHVQQALGKLWADASDTEKSHFQGLAAADKEKYDAAMAKYVHTDEYKAYEAAFKE